MRLLVRKRAAKWYIRCRVYKMEKWPTNGRIFQKSVITDTSVNIKNCAKRSEVCDDQFREGIDRQNGIV